MLMSVGVMDVILPPRPGRIHGAVRRPAVRSPADFGRKAVPRAPDPIGRRETSAMSARVILLDSDEVDLVQRELADVHVERADRLPSGAGVVALLVHPGVAVGADAIAALPDLRIVAATSAGYDHLDLDAIAAAGVWATHCPGYCD